MKKIIENGAELMDVLSTSPVWDTLEAFARTSIQQWVQRLLIEEVDELLGRRKSERVHVGHATGEMPVYRNGFGKARKLALTSGTITVKRPRVRGLVERFESQLLPLFKKSTDQVGALLPELYLHGLSLGDFDLALRGLLGDGAPLSASSIMRLKEEWQAQYDTWQRRDLSQLDLVYLWAEGVYVKAGLEKEKAALLVLIGATADGDKVILAVTSGYRESRESWGAVLRDLKARGLRSPQLAIADGHLGIWSALCEVYPKSAEQRYCNHKLRNGLDVAPKKYQAAVKIELQAMAAAETQAACETLRTEFRTTHERAHPKAVALLELCVL